MDHHRAAEFVEGWERAWNAHDLGLLPDLRFTVEAVYAGIDAVVINYRNHRGNRVCEFLAFDGPLIASGHATYLTDSAAAASGLAPSGQQG